MSLAQELARVTEWDIASTEAKKYRYTQRTVSNLSLKGWFGYRLTHRYLLAERSLGQNNDIAAICDICLLEQQGFPTTWHPMQKPITQHPVQLLLFGSHLQQMWPRQNLHTTALLPFLAKLAPRLAWLALKTPWQRATASKQGYWLLSLAAFLTNFRVTTGLQLFTPKASAYAKKAPKLNLSLGLG